MVLMHGTELLSYAPASVVVMDNFHLTEMEKSICPFSRFMKRKKKDSSGSLDSLLDTITTVVGILIILLIVVQLGADSAVKRIVDEKKRRGLKGIDGLGDEAI